MKSISMKDIYEKHRQAFHKRPDIMCDARLQRCCRKTFKILAALRYQNAFRKIIDY